MKINNTEDIALEIRRARKLQGLTQKQLAGLCNISVGFIIAVEKGKETAHIGKVITIIKMLGLNIEIGK